MLAFSVLGICVAIAQVARGDGLFMNERPSLDTEYRGKGGEDGPKYFRAFRPFLLLDFFVN